MRVSCGLGGHVRDRHRCHEGEYALVSSRFTKTAHPACPPACAPHTPAALGCTGSTVPPPNFPPRGREPRLPRKWGPGSHLPPEPVCESVTPAPPPQDVTQVGPDCEGGGLRGRQESGFGPATRNSGAAQDRERGRRGSPLLPPRRVGPERADSETQGQACPPRGLRAS